MKKSLTSILAVLVLLLGVLCYFQWRDASDARQALAGAAGEREKLNLRVATLEKRNRELLDKVSAARDAAPAPTPPPFQAGGARTMNFRVGGPDGPGGLPGPMRALDSPEMRRLMAIGQKGQLDSRYAALFKSLGLAPQQLDKFKQLLVDKQNAMSDVLSAARSQGLVGPGSREQIQALVQDANNELDASIKGLLGDAAFQQYQQFDRTEAQRGVVDQLTNRLSYTDTPLTAQQSEQLVQLLARTAPAPTTSNGNMGVFSSAGMVTTFSSVVGSPGGGAPANVVTVMGGAPAAPITPEAVAQAENLLNPAQLAALQQLQAEQQAQQQMGQVMRQTIESQGGPGSFRAVGDGGAVAPSPPPRG